MIQLSDESQIEFQDTGDSDSEDDELEVLKAQDQDSEVRLQKVVFEKFYNSVDTIGHIRLSNFQVIIGWE